MNITSKIICTMVIICSSVLIFLTGRTNVRNFEKVHTSIEEIYKDRLVVKGLIFDLSSLLHRKELAIVSGDQTFYINTNESTNSQMTELLNQFRSTYLTPLEESTLNHFSHGLKKLQENEKEVGLSNGFDNIENIQKSSLIHQIKNLKGDLKTLASIQLSEGRRKLSMSDKAVESMYQFESFENYALIILGLLMLGLIFVPKPREDG